YPRSVFLDDVPRLVDAEIGHAGMHAVALDQRLVALEVTEGPQGGEHTLQGLFRRLHHRVVHELGVLRRLVRRLGIDAGEAGQLSRQRLLVEVFRVAVRRDLRNGRVDVHLDEVADLRADGVPGLSVRADGATDRGNAVAGEEVRHEPDPHDVEITVLFGEAETFGQLLPHDVTVEDLGLHPPGLELVVQHLGDRRLAGARKAGEPNGEPAVLRHARKLLPTAPGNALDASMSYRERMVGPTSTRRSPSILPVGWRGAPFKMR